MRNKEVDISFEDELFGRDDMTTNTIDWCDLRAYFFTSVISPFRSM